jgi:hypothetical protein
MHTKQYIQVIASFTKEGKVLPLSVVADNGLSYPVDKVTQVINAASLKSGGAGIRYTCHIGGHIRYLYLEDTRWFIEKKENS